LTIEELIIDLEDSFFAGKISEDEFIRMMNAILLSADDTDFEYRD
jgi:hypothetical protein